MTNCAGLQPHISVVSVQTIPCSLPLWFTRHTFVWLISRNKTGRTVLIFLESEHILCVKFSLITLASATPKSAAEGSGPSPLTRSPCQDSSSRKKFWHWMKLFADWSNSINAKARLLSFVFSAALQRKKSGICWKYPPVLLSANGVSPKRGCTQR